MCGYKNVYIDFMLSSHGGINWMFIYLLSYKLMKKILHLVANLLQENQIVLLIDTDVDSHSICMRFLVNFTNVIPQTICPSVK